MTRARRHPAQWETPQTPGMQVRLLPGKGGGDFVLRWKTLGPNRDRSRTGEPPAPTQLRLYFR
jgi:hypothetical protein